MKIYTKRGDKGKTVLLNGKTISKSSTRIAACGDIDELNTQLGFAISTNQSTDKDEKINGILRELQKDTCNVGSLISGFGADSKDAEDERCGCAGADVDASAGTDGKQKKNLEKATARLEKNIDELCEKLKPVNRFILPSGSQTATALHIARTVCRRAERSCVLLFEKEEISEHVIIYLNRLSDLLFVLARYANKGKDEFA